jgi:Domain of unknown function (DUF4349)
VLQAIPSPATADQSQVAPGAAAVPGLTAKIIKTASLSVSIRPRTFDEKIQEATMAAQRHGGFVSSSQTSEAVRQSGTLVLRVPVDQFEATLGDLRRLGKVKSQTISGQDVTGQVVDLQARLRNWEAQEAVLLRLMDRAKTIEDSIVVQGHLQDVQLSIEEIKGQLRALQDQTSFSTISLSLSEVGFVPPKPKSSGLTFGKAWHMAWHGFVGVLAAVLVALGFLIPVALLAAAVLLVLLGYRRLRRAPA